MCDVCVAEGALRKQGIRITWDEAPKTAKAVLLFADGTAEGPARYCIHLEGVLPDPSADRREYTDDLALVCMRYGLDIRWRWVPKAVQDWVLGKRARPTMEQIIKSRRNGRRRPRSDWKGRVTDTLLWHLEHASDTGLVRVKRVPQREIDGVIKAVLKRYEKWLAAMMKPPKKTNVVGYKSRLMNNLRVYDRTPAKA